MAEKRKKNAAKRAKAKKGEKYKCNNCGLVVLVEDECGCDDECNPECCGEPMACV